MSNYEDLRGAAANDEIILDDMGIPSVMVKVPLVYLDELGIEPHTRRTLHLLSMIKWCRISMFLSISMQLRITAPIPYLIRIRQTASRLIGRLKPAITRARAGIL